MRILFVVSALDTEFGGPPVSIVGAATGLADLGNDVTIMIFGQTSHSVKDNEDFFSKLTKHNVKVIVAKAKRTSIYGGIGSFKDLQRLTYEIKKTDVISSHALYNFQNILLYFILLYIPKSHTLMPHGTLTKYQRRIHRYRKLIVDLLFVKIILKQVDGIFLATQVEKNELSFKMQKKSFVVGLGVIPNLDVVLGSNTKQGVPKFLFLGRIAPVKRLDLAIESFALFVNKTSRDYRLIVCGNGNPEYVQSMVRIANDLGVSELVEFRGWIDLTEKTKVFEECNWLLVPSENENFSNTVAEGLTFGIPCLLSKNVALSSVVNREGAGEVFSTLSPPEISDAMLRIVQSDQNAIRSAALRAGNHFAWDKVCLEWMSGFKHIMQEIELHE